MLQTLKTTFKLDISMSVNAFLYYFKRIPVIGNIFSDYIYSQVSLKSAIAVLVFILKLLRGFAFKALYVGLGIFLPIMTIYSKEIPATRINIFIYTVCLLLCVIRPLLFSDILDSSKEKLIAIKILHIPANRYYTIHTIYKAIYETFLFLPSILLFTLIAKGTLLLSIFLIINIGLFRLIIESFHIVLYSKTKFIIKNHMFFHVILLVILIALTYVPMLFKLIPTIDYIVYSIPFFCIVLFLCIISTFHILAFKDYSKVFHASNKVDEVSKDRKKIAREASFRDVSLKDTDLVDSYKHQNIYTNKRGYTYLNAIFFERHRRMLLKPMLINLAGIGLAFLIALLSLLILPEFKMLYFKLLKNFFPTLVFVMYLLSLFLCQRATKAMFYNCDISLLRYSYYRKSSVILLNFRLRLKRILLINGAPALAIAFTIFLLTILADKKELISTTPIILLVLVLSIFFSVHHLFMYYVFQPYTTDLEIKNPIYKVVNGIIYILSYICLQIRQAPNAFLVIVLAATILYTVIALLLIIKYAPKTFRVK